MPEFDFAAEDIDEQVSIQLVPQGLSHSISMSRCKEENLSSHRKVLKDLEIFIQDSKDK